MSIGINPIAVEAFGRHLKRVDTSAPICLDVRFGLTKLKSQLRKGEIACDFLLACNFTDAWLLSLNLLWFAGKGLTGIGLFLTVPTVMRPCDGTSGLVRGNRRKAVFAFRGCFPKDFFHVFALGQRIYIAYFRSEGKNRKSPSATRFSATKPQVAEAQNRGLVGRF